MRIISDFHDYYDSVQGYGFDPTVIYLRKTLELKKSESLPAIYKFRLSGLYRDKFNYHIQTSGEIFFCGDRYRFVCFQNDDFTIKEKYFYNKEDLLLYVSKAYKKDIKKMTKREKRRRDYRKDIEKFFNVDNNFEENVRLHEKFNSPIFISYCVPYGDSKVIINPVLKDMNFQVILDPYSAFQQIDMFLSGVMQSTENETVQISDEIRKKKHGFDETSFRPKMKVKAKCGAI